MVEKLIRYILLAAVISISMVLFAQDKPQEKKSSIGKTIKKTIETIDKQTLYKEKKETEQIKQKKNKYKHISRLILIN